MSRLAVAVIAVAVIASSAFQPAPPSRAASTPTTAVEATAAAVPLVVLMDTSDSMEETVPASDAPGDVKKLDAAKRALQEPIRNQPPGSKVGIWTYPGGTTGKDGCDAGGWLVDLDTAAGSADVLNRISSLTADGDTPTGPALSAVVADLRARGVQGANILVVSDGLYTCGADPCEVAEELAGTGFEVSIQTVGFDISPEGRDSLKCMAEATGGNYFDASDSAELTQVINELTTPKFTLTLAADKAPVRGKKTTIKATLKNVSALDAHSVGLNLAFSNKRPGLVTPTVVPATIGLGTLPAGRSASRSWTFVASEQAATSEYSVSATSLETLPVQVGGAFTTSAPGFQAADAGPMLSNLIKNKQSLVILGDSYSSGEGTYSYLPETPGISGSCHRSPETYLASRFTAAKVRVEILACSGAVANDLQAPQSIAESGGWKADPQLAQLAALPSTPGVAVMTLGGNDIGFKSILTRCVSPFDSCASPTYQTVTLATIPMHLDALVAAYAGAWRVLNRPEFVSSRGGDFAPLIVVAYPKVVHETSLFRECAAAAGASFDASEVSFANRLVEKLNQTIALGVSRARAGGAEVYFVKTTQDAFVPGHTVCDSADDRWVNRLDIKGWPPNAESVHPTEAGYAAITDEIIEWSKTTDRVRPTAAGKKYSETPDALLDQYLHPSFEKGKRLRPSAEQSATFHPSQSMLLAEPGMGTYPVTVTLHSQPRILATIAPDPEGTVHEYVSLPADVKLGAHEVTLTGWDEDGNQIVKTASIVVRPATPAWVWTLGIGGVLTLGVTVLVFLRRRPARIRVARAGRTN
jgi:lysophospholipase L1-like esterase